MIYQNRNQLVFSNISSKKVYSYYKHNNKNDLIISNYL